MKLETSAFHFFFFCLLSSPSVLSPLSLSLSHTHTHTHTHTLTPNLILIAKTKASSFWHEHRCRFKAANSELQFFSPNSVSHKPHNVQGYQSVLFSILILPYLLSRPWQEEIGVETDEDCGAVLPSWTDIIHLALIHSLSHGTKGISVAISKHSISSRLYIDLNISHVKIA